VCPTIRHRDDGPMAARITRGDEKSGTFSAPRWTAIMYCSALSPDAS
jgi:hypothetical protein